MYCVSVVCSGCVQPDQPVSGDISHPGGACKEHCPEGKYTYNRCTLYTCTLFMPISAGACEQGSKGEVTMTPPFSEQLGYRPIPLLLVSHKWRQGQVRERELRAVQPHSVSL